MPQYDDWRSETILRLEKSALFNRLKELSDRDPAGTISTWKKDIRTASLKFMDATSGTTEIQVVLQERK